MKLLVIFIALLPFIAKGQTTTSSKFKFGIEQDFLPYITGGYFAGAWVGKNHIRVRVLTAKVNKPDFIVKHGFTNNSVTAYAIVGDYFLKNNWEGWWISSGIVQWKSSIQSDQQINTARFNNVLLNGSLGYNWPFARKFYLSPWAGLHLRIGGTRTVTVDGKIFIPPLLNPEASLKLGYFF